MALPLKTGADFFGLEALRMKLHNSPADLTEGGEGTIYFNSSTSGNTSKRIRYCYGIGSNNALLFHSLATLQDLTDLDAAKAEELSKVSERVATIEEMLTVDTVEDAISTWEEIQKFFENVGEDINFATAYNGLVEDIANRYTKAESDARYLQLTGGTITSPSHEALVINRTGGHTPYLSFNSDGVNLGRIGFDTTSKDLVASVKGATQTLIHSGNIANYAAKKDGSNATGVWQNGAIGLYRKATQISSANFIPASGMMEYYNNFAYNIEGGFAGQDYANALLNLKLIDFADSSQASAQLGIASNSTMFFRIVKDGSYDSAWKQFFFSDGSVEMTGLLSAPHGISTNQITIGGITLSVVDGQLQIDGSVYATGTVAAGGTAEEGEGSGGGGSWIGSLLESWTGEVTGDQALSSVLGVELNNRLTTAESNIASNKDEISYLKNISGKYLTTNGGTISGNLQIGEDANTDYRYIRIKRNGSNVDVNHSDTHGALLYDGVGFTFNKTVAKWNSNTLIHSGNVGDYALKTDGSNSMKGPLMLQGTEDISTVNNMGMFIGRSNKAGGAAFDFASFINIPDKGISQLQLSWCRDFHNLKLATRVFESNNWSGWKTIAFTDSDITGNASSASVLILDSGHWYASYSETQKYIAFGKEGYNCYIEGANTYFGYNGIIGMLLNSSGNVTIGNTDRLGASTTTKLYVDGGIRFAQRTFWGQPFDGTGSVDGTLRTVGGIQLNRQMMFNIDYDTNEQINSSYAGMRVRMESGCAVIGMHNGATIESSVILNSSGNVTIGDSDLAVTNVMLYVNGDAYYNGAIKTNNVIQLYGKSGLSSDVYLDNITYAGLNIRTSSSSYMFIGNNVGIGTIYPEYRLHVSGTLGVTGVASFAQRVNVGGATDDANYALKVLGKAYIDGAINTNGNISIYGGNLSLRPATNVYGDIGMTSTYMKFQAIHDGVAYLPISLNPNGGNVLIGTTTDSGYRLDVDGTFRATSINAASANLKYIELNYNTPYIDFHFDNDTADYTSRIIESSKGVLTFQSGIEVTNIATFDTRVNMKSALYLNSAGSGILIPNTGASIHWHDASGADIASLMSFNALSVTMHKDTKIEGDLTVTGNIFADGQVAAGGTAEEGTGGSGGTASKIVFDVPVGTTSIDLEHGFFTKNVIVQIYEKESPYQLVMADVYLTTDNVATVSFGKATDVDHKVVIMA